MSGTLFIIAAPSGTGKTTLVRALCTSMANLQVSVSCTTRPQRPGEKHGIDYYFIDNKTFDEMVAQQQFLEHERVFDHYYGTPYQWVNEQLGKGTDVILEIDWQGARGVREKMPDKTVSIFILPPAFATLEQRLKERGQDNAGTIRRRMQDAVNELSHYREFDYLVINDDLDRALSELRSIIEYRRRGEQYPPGKLMDFAESLMAEAGKIQ